MSCFPTYNPNALQRDVSSGEETEWDTFVSEDGEVYVTFELIHSVCKIVISVKVYRETCKMLHDVTGQRFNSNR